MARKKREYNNKWMFRERPFENEDIGEFEGFVYLIVHLKTNKKYIGRKYFYAIRTVPGKGRRQKIDSDWKHYYGSNKVLKEFIQKEGKENFKRIILSLHKTQGDCNYEEVKQQFIRNVLEDDSYLNDNINGAWYRKPQHITDARLYNNEFEELNNTPTPKE